MLVFVALATLVIILAYVSLVITTSMLCSILCLLYTLSQQSNLFERVR